MADRFAIGMVLLDRGALSEEARSRFVAALDGGTATEPDDTGAFEVSVECASQDEVRILAMRHQSEIGFLP